MESTRKPCFIEEDDGLASLADMEAGFSGNHTHHHLLSRPLYYSASPLKSSQRNFSVFSPISVKFYEGRYEEHRPHFLDSCFLCKKPIGHNTDIFMYRGDTPFCSEECREEQIEIDEAKEKNWNLSVSMKALRKKDQKKSTSPNKTSPDYPFHTGAVAAA